MDEAKRNLKMREKRMTRQAILHSPPYCRDKVCSNQYLRHSPSSVLQFIGDHPASQSGKRRPRTVIRYVIPMSLKNKDIPASMDMTLRMTFSTLCTGLHRSEADSYIVGSSPGACKIEMQTVPSG